jgi:hypothetical protein
MRQLVVYFCRHRAKYPGKGGKLASPFHGGIQSQSAVGRKAILDAVGSSARQCAFKRDPEKRVVDDIGDYQSSLI